MEEKAFCNFLYEKDNHLGNVLTVVSDKPIPVDDANDSDIDWFLADIRQSTDYSGFGVQLENRNLLLTGVGEDYSIGFQGQFEDDEIKGEGNSVNYSFRMHDPRLGRFFAIDPLSREYPHNSPYAFSENVVINAVELEGLEKIFVYNEYTNAKGVLVVEYSHTVIDKTLKEDINRRDHYNAHGDATSSTYKKLDGSGAVNIRSGTEYKNPLSTWFKSTEPYDALGTKVDNEKQLHGTGDKGTWEGKGPVAGIAIGVEASLSTPAGGTEYNASIYDAGGGSGVKAENTNTLLNLSTGGVNKVDVNAYVDIKTTKGLTVSNKPYTSEAKVSISLGYLTISGYQDSDGNSGFKFSFSPVKQTDASIDYSIKENKPKK